MRPFRLSVDEIVALVNPTRREGSTSAEITSVVSIENAKAGDLAFLETAHYISEFENERYAKFAATTNASILLVPEGFAAPAPKKDQLFLFVKKPSLMFAKVCGKIETLINPKPPRGIHPTAVVDREARVHSSASVGPMCVIEAGAEVHAGAVLHAQVYVGSHATIGSNSELKAHATVMNDCEVGTNCIIHSGAVIGSDGFGFVFDAGVHKKVPQIGNVIVEDDVEIGANTTIDRARFGITRIGRGTKIDNLVQIGHNCNIGCGCLIAAQAALAGGVIFEDYVVAGGQSGVVGGVVLGTQTKLAAGTGVTKSFPAKSTLLGYPAADIKKAQKIEAMKRRLPELFERVEKLEEKTK
jgi:UDP-3-O-[3-hydroxymyristoyl] glucosamine N-acyltransferase